MEYYVQDGTDIMGFETKAEAARYILAEKGRRMIVADAVCVYCLSNLVKEFDHFRCTKGHKCDAKGALIE